MTAITERIFFSGIAGSGMSGLALFMNDKGCRVSGSDRAIDRNPDHPVKKIFEAAGVRVFPQDGSGIYSSIDSVVFSTAIEKDNPEYARASELGINTMTRPELLSDIVKLHRTVAVSGTSGKSTAAGILAFIMSRLGMKPNFIGGGAVRQFMTGRNTGNFLSGDSDILVIEACESDASIINYRPEHTVLLNLALDHHDIEKTASMFVELSSNTTGKIFVNADDLRLRGIVNGSIISFSLDAPSDYQASQIMLDDLGSRFLLNGVKIGMRIPGRHNIVNAIASLGVLRELGVPIEESVMHLKEFEGIVRRFEVIRDDRAHLVVDDYAHNPHKIAALMQTVSSMRKSICYVFQPHGFGPTRLMKDEYIRVFNDGLRESDMLIVLPIYYAGGTASRDISSEDIVAPLNYRGRNVMHLMVRDEVPAIARGYEACIVFGARDGSLNDLARDIADSL